MDYDAPSEKSTLHLPVVGVLLFEAEVLTVCETQRLDLDL